MPSKEFIQFSSRVPAGPPTGNGMPEGAPQGGPNAFVGVDSDFGVPVLPEGYVPPEPEIPAGCTGEKVVINGVVGLHVKSPMVTKKRALLYIHGGGFTIGSAMTAGTLLKLFGDACGLDGYAVEYALAPKHPFPEGLNDCIAMYQGLLDMGYEQIVVGGESAGAALTLSMTLALKDRGIPLPTALWCSSPVDDLRVDAHPVYREDFLYDCSPKIAAVYAPDTAPDNPLIAPLYGDFTGMPPMILQTGGGESLAAGCVRLAQKAAAANVEMVLHFGQDMPHTFAMDYLHYPEAQFAMQEILNFIRLRLDICA